MIVGGNLLAAVRIAGGLNPRVCLKLALRGKLPHGGVENPPKSRSKGFRDGRKWSASYSSQLVWHLSRCP